MLYFSLRYQNACLHQLKAQNKLAFHRIPVFMCFKLCFQFRWCKLNYEYNGWSLVFIYNLILVFVVMKMILFTLALISKKIKSEGSSHVFLKEKCYRSTLQIQYKVHIKICHSLKYTAHFQSCISWTNLTWLGACPILSYTVIV